MQITGRFAGLSVSMDGKMTISFDVNEKAKASEEVDAIKDLERLNISAVRYRAKRSLDANAYFWQLVDKIARAVGSDKWTIYLMLIAERGVFADMTICREGLSTIKRQFRYVDVLDEGYERDGKEYCTVRCYFGSSTYDTAEMSYLIEGTVEQAKQLGIETMTPDEISALLASWKGDAYGYKQEANAV